MKTAKQVAADLQTLYQSEFAGKTMGRYKLSKADFKLLSGRKTLQLEFLAEVTVEAEETYDLLVIPIGGGRYFGVVAQAKIDGWRPVPARLIIGG